MTRATTKDSVGGAGVPEATPLGQLGLRLAWLAAFALWAFLAASLLTFDRADPPTHAVWPANEQVSNWVGPAGAWAAYQMLRLLGVAIGVPLVVGFAWLMMKLVGKARRGFPVAGLVGTATLTVVGACFASLVFRDWGPLPGLAGGSIGVVSAEALSARFGMGGSLLWLGFFAAAGLLLGFDRMVIAVPKWAWGAVTRGREARKGATERALEDGRERTGMLRTLIARLTPRRPVAVRLDDLEDEPIVVRPSRKKKEGKKDKKSKGKKKSEPEPEDESEYEYEEDDGDDWEYEDEDEEYDENDYEEDEEDEYEEEDEAEDEPADEDELPGAPQVLAEEQLREKMSKLPVRFSGASRRLATEDDLRDLQGVMDMEGYKFPGLDLLEDPEEDFSQSLEALVREQARALEHALQQYRIDGEVVGIESGPVITQYDVRLAPGTKVAQLTGVSSDIARALKAINIRIVPNQVGRDTVGVEVPNPKKEKVRLKELMSNTDRFNSMKLPTFLGKDAAGDPLIADLAEMPHMLIAGTTGSGKSVCMNTIIMGWLYTKKPNELKMVLVDPKMVEMSQFKDIPHLMCPVITEMSKAAAILEWACGKMDERYELLAEAGCRDIAAYNALEFEEICERIGVENEQERARIPRRLPYMVFIIDELADLMMTNKEVEGSIIRIAQKARAVGIHLILATQRPQANVVTGLIKSNMPCRIAFKVASAMDSRIVLDQKGGELLLGQGDMLFLSPRSHKVSRAQGTLVDDAETRRVVRFMRDVARPTFERQLMQLRSGGAAGSDEDRILESKNNSSASLKAAQEDPMFDRAVEIVLETQRGSVSLLQRRLAIGYTRASRLIDLMGIAGIIGEHKGSVAREVMINTDDWARMKILADEEARQSGQQPVFSGATQEESSLFAESEEATTGVATLSMAEVASDEEAGEPTGSVNEDGDWEDEDEEEEEEGEEDDEEWDEEDEGDEEGEEEGDWEEEEGDEGEEEEDGEDEEWEDDEGGWDEEEEDGEWEEEDEEGAEEGDEEEEHDEDEQR